MPDTKSRRISHETGVKVIDILTTETDSVLFGMAGNCILSLSYGAPGVNTFLKAQSRQEATDTFTLVKKADGTDWTYPSDASVLTAAGNVGADAFKEFIGLGEVEFIAQAAQTGGWALKVRVTG